MQALGLTPAQTRAYTTFTSGNCKLAPGIRAAVAQALPNANPTLQTQYMLQMYYDLTNGSKVAFKYWCVAGRHNHLILTPQQVAQGQANIAQGIATYKPATIAKWQLAAQQLLNS